MRFKVAFTFPIGNDRALMKSIPSDSGVRSSKVNSNDPHLNAFLAAYAQKDPSALQRSLAAMLQSGGFTPPRDEILLADFGEKHLARKGKKLAVATMAKMRLAITSFCKLHKGALLNAIVGEDLQSWVDGMEARGLSPGTVRVQFFCVFAMFQRAASLGLIRSNPCADVELPDEESVVKRLPLGDEDFERLLVYLKAEGLWEWVTCALLMRYSSARLGDAARMPCSAIEIRGSVTCLNFTATKTGAGGSLPILFQPMIAHLQGFVIQTGMMCPELSTKSVSCLSKRFTALLKAAGIDTQPVTLPNGRVVDRVSAHSLRHSYIDGMDKLGMPEDLRMRLAAHSSAKSHRRYVHADPVDLYGKAAAFINT